jgi:hypothetical protein
MHRPAALATAVACLLAALLGFSQRAEGKRPEHRVLTQFRTMFGVDGAFVGEAGTLGSFAGDELPWEIEHVVGKLDQDGRLFLAVKGLVFSDDPVVPEELRGKNDETEFRAAVLCLTEENGAIVPRSVVSQGFPANEHGDSTIRTNLALPDPCIAPVVLVLAGSEDKWFAATGFETED